jgi:arylsulfatase A-like enzyme
MGIDAGLPFDGRSMMPLVCGGEREPEPEFYITECTWMRKHGWRTPEWKLIRALEPDFHFKPMVELYNLIKDPEENNNVADEYPEVVEVLTKRMNDWIAKRTEDTGRPNPIDVNFLMNNRPFTSSQEAYDSKYIGGIADAVKLQKK